MKQKMTRVATTALLALTMLCCQVLHKDELSIDDSSEILKSTQKTTHVYKTTAGTSLMLNPFLGITVSQPVTAKIAHQPLKGHATIVKNGLIEYKPAEFFVSGEDDVIVEYLNANNTVIFVDTLKVQLSNIIEGMPCLARSEHGFTFNVAKNSGIAIDVFGGGWDDCNVGSRNFSFNIFEQADHGIAAVTKGAFNEWYYFTYIPNQGYAGEDQFTFEICEKLADGTLSCEYGVVNVNVVEIPETIPCLGDNGTPEVPIKVRMNTGIAVDVFGNAWEECNLFDLNLDFLILKNSEHGTVSALQGEYSEMMYYSYVPTTNYVGPDHFVIKICVTLADGSKTCEFRDIYLDVVNEQACIIGTEEDVVQINSNDPQEITIDVLANDRTCGYNLYPESLVVIAPKIGSAVVSNGKIKYSRNATNTSYSEEFFYAVGSDPASGAGSITGVVKVTISPQ